MKILAFGDVYWRVWRKALKKELPGLQEKYNPDFIIVNVDNITSWRWAVDHHVEELNAIWVDIMTWGDHIYDNFSHIKSYLQSDNTNLLVPANTYETDTGIWFKVFEKNWKRLLVIHLMWNVFMRDNLYNPFLKADEILALDHGHLDGIVVDFHKEATSEIYGLAMYLDGRISSIFGTHTHVQTNDEQILPKWTALMCDIGMVWPLYTVIGATFDSVKNRFLTGINKWKIEQGLWKDYVLGWMYTEIDPSTMKSTHIEKIRIQWTTI